MRILIASVIVFLCAVNNAYGSLDNVFGSWPGEVANVFTTAWKSIKNAVSKPVKIKRLGAGGKRKTELPPPNTTVPPVNLTTVPTMASNITINTTPTPTTTPTPQQATILDAPNTTAFHTLTSNSPLKVMIPVLLTPAWKNMDEWNNLQKPIIGYKAVNETSTADNSTPVPETYNGTLNDKAVVSEDEYFGVLMFV